MNLEALFTLFSGLPRQGPGSDRSTLDALRRLPPLPPQATVLDLGCGTGRQTLVLARELRARITAIDIHQPYLDGLARNAAAAGLSDFIRTRCLSMDALDYPPASIDLFSRFSSTYGYVFYLLRKPPTPNPQRVRIGERESPPRQLSEDAQLLRAEYVGAGATAGPPR